MQRAGGLHSKRGDELGYLPFFFSSSSIICLN